LLVQQVLPIRGDPFTQIRPLHTNQTASHKSDRFTQIRQSGPGIQVKQLKPFELFPFGSAAVSSEWAGRPLTHTHTHRERERERARERERERERGWGKTASFEKYIQMISSSTLCPDRKVTCPHES